MDHVTKIDENKRVESVGLSAQKPIFSLDRQGGTTCERCRNPATHSLFHPFFRPEDARDFERLCDSCDPGWKHKKGSIYTEITQQNTNTQTCPICGGPFQDDGIWFSHANDCADALAEEQPRCCETCGGSMCEHDICRDNWCGMDHHCTECADREWREIEAEDNAKYYEGDFE